VPCRLLRSLNIAPHRNRHQHAHLPAVMLVFVAVICQEIAFLELSELDLVLEKSLWCDERVSAEPQVC
jgi:hypothetical protein